MAITTRVIDIKSIDDLIKAHNEANDNLIKVLKINFDKYIDNLIKRNQVESSVLKKFKQNPSAMYSVVMNEVLGPNDKNRFNDFPHNKESSDIWKQFVKSAEKYIHSKLI